MGKTRRGRKLNMIFFFMWILCESGNCQTYSDMKTLYTSLFANYKKQLVPHDPTSPLEVKIDSYLNSINHFHEVDETLSLSLSFYLQWKDTSLSWTPSSHNYLYSMGINPMDLWIPDIFVLNRADKVEPVGAGISFQATLTYEGTIHYSPGAVMDAKCKTDISNFPYDSQSCTLSIIAWGIPSETLYFTPLSSEPQRTYFTENSDWNLVESEAGNSTFPGYSMYYVSLKIKRAPLYYSTMVVLPTLLFAILNPLVFVLPVDSGERIGLSMTILLSYAIFLTLVSSSIPASSNPMCVLLIIMIIIITVSGMIALVSIFVVKVYHIEDTSSLPSCVLKLTTWAEKRKANKVKPLVDQKSISITGREAASMLDTIALIVFYIIIFVVIVAYFIYVFV